MNYKRKLKVLVFEDDQALGDLFKVMLKSLGYEIHLFQDPTEFSQCDRSDCKCLNGGQCADIIICDIMMPKVSGVDFLRLQQLKHCKISDQNKALMSAGIPPHLKTSVESIGCHFFRKPFAISEVKKWLDECSMRISRQVNQETT